MQCHHLVSAVPKHSADLDVLCPRVEHLHESPVWRFPFCRSGLRDGPRITHLLQFLGRLVDVSMTELRTKESSFAEEFNVDRHFRNAGSSWKSSITVFENSGWSDPSSLRYFFTHSIRRRRNEIEESDARRIKRRRVVDLRGSRRRSRSGRRAPCEAAPRPISGR